MGAEDAPRPRVLKRVLRASKSLEFHEPSRALFVAAHLKRLPAAGALDESVVRMVKEAVLWASEKLAASV